MEGLFLLKENIKLAAEMEDLFRLMNKWTKCISKRNFRVDDSSDITLSQYRLLQILKNHGPCRMSELSAHIKTSLGSLTSMIDRLVEKHLVERFLLPEDRRVIMVKITSSGLMVLDDCRANFISIIVNNLNKIDDTDILSVEQAINQLRYIMNEYFLKQEDHC